MYSPLAAVLREESRRGNASLLPAPCLYTEAILRIQVFYWL